jgi:hypothetical protein
LVGLAVAIGILEEKDVVAVGHINSAVTRKNPRRDVQVVCKYGMLVGHPVSIGIFEYDQAVRFLLTGLDVWVKWTAHHP